MANKQQVPEIVKHFLKSLPIEAKPLLIQKGVELAAELGLDTVRDVVFDVLCGINIRDSTESLTRKRIALLNAATIAQYAAVPGGSVSLDSLVDAVASSLRLPMAQSESWILNWALGLTDKARQNVLRDGESLEAYKERFKETLTEAAASAGQDFGELSGSLTVGKNSVALNWPFLLYLATSIGSQTLTIRGSDKSTYGKLFEKLVLGSVLSILGFHFVPSGPANPTPGQYWLSSTSKRESDATLLVELGKGVRFDIGFIGRGNSEISLDKVSRFARREEFNKQTYQMVTFVIVDKIGQRSKLEELAKDIDGTVIQMSLTYWPQTLAKRLHERFGYNDELVVATHDEVRDIIKSRLASSPMLELLKIAAVAAESEESERA